MYLDVDSSVKRCIMVVPFWLAQRNLWVNWNQGFIFKNDRVVLLVTLDKSRQAEEPRYEDRFEAPTASVAKPEQAAS